MKNYVLPFSCLFIMVGLVLQSYFPSFVIGQDAPSLSIKGDGVKVVKVDKIVIVKEDATIIQSFPFTINAPPGAGLYFWVAPSGFIFADRGDSLEITTAPKGAATISVKSILPDLDKDGKFKGFLTKFYSVSFSVGDTAPTPIPPIPVPVPPVPVPVPPGPKEQKLWLVVIEETAEATTMRSLMFKDPALKSYIEAKGHRVRIFDKDAKDAKGQQPAWMASYLDHAKGKALPYIIITDMMGSSTVIYEGAFPLAVPEILGLIKKAGG